MDVWNKDNGLENADGLNNNNIDTNNNIINNSNNNTFGQTAGNDAGRAFASASAPQQNGGYYNPPPIQGYPGQGYNEYSYQPAGKKKKKKGGGAAVIILAVCLLAVSSVVGYSLLNSKGDLKPSRGSSSSARSENNNGNGNSDVSDNSTKRDPRDQVTLEQLAAPEDAMSIPDIVTKLSPSVVGISCITDQGQVSGTGIVLNEKGYVVTNAHVVEGASAVSIVLTDSTSQDEESSDDSSKTVAEQILEDQNGGEKDDSTIVAEIVGMDTQTDLAVLKVEDDGLVPAEFGTSSDIMVGELAIVIGNPLGFDLANTVTSGIISATDRKLTIEDRTMNLIQTDASINSGNSGGPLINAYGQVIGITSAKVSSTYGEGLGFAIPIDDAKKIIEDLTAYGYVKGRPTLGISGQNVNSFYAQYYNVPQGFIVSKIDSGSAAEKAGIQVNDIIVGIEGKMIDSIEQFNEIKSGYKAGDTISVSVYRNENIMDIDVVLGEATNTETAPSDEQQGYDDNYGDYGNGYDDFFDYYNRFMR